ncbi:MAG: TIGR02099 family protein, partial [Rhodoferax sp.]|nr:TIGR02099 family protein [Rhodoferax sp.]
MARWACWLVLVAGIALGLAWGALHFLIVPRIDAFGPWLEQQASQRLGVPVRLGSMVARSNGLLASLELREVQILDTSGHAALRLPLVLVALSPRSVLGWGFEQLYIDGPELEVRRSADGRIWIAGMELPTTQSNDHAAVDWLFAQPEVVLRHGILRWRDELRNQPTLQLGEVQLILRKQYLGHHFRVDAKAPAGWGTQMTLMGQFQQPLWTLRAGDWRNWVGQVFAQADHLDLAQLRNYVDLGAERDLTQGSGSVRAWLDVDHSRITSATADLALQAVSARLAADLEPLELQRISGRLVARQSGQGKELLAQGLSFTTRDGLHWPGGNLQLTLTDAAAPAQPQHQPPPQTQPQT